MGAAAVLAAGFFAAGFLAAGFFAAGFLAAGFGRAAGFFFATGFFAATFLITFLGFAPAPVNMATSVTAVRDKALWPTRDGATEKAPHLHRGEQALAVGGERGSREHACARSDQERQDHLVHHSSL